MIRHDQKEILERDFSPRFNEPISHVVTNNYRGIERFFAAGHTNPTTFAFDVHGIDFPAMPVTKLMAA